MSDEDSKALARQKYLETIADAPTSYQEWLDRLPESKRQRVMNGINRMTHGLYASAPLQCHGPDNCPFITACPIAGRKPNGELDVGDFTDYPVGLQCVMEANYMAQQVVDYMNYLEIDPSNPVERAICDELAVIDLLKTRALLVIAHGDTSGQGRDLLRIDKTINGFSQNGTPLTSESSKLHPALEYIDRLEKRREKWLDRLMETRKAKADYNLKVGNTVSDNALLEDVNQLRQFLQQRDTKQIEQILDGSEQMIGLDEFIEDHDE